MDLEEKVIRVETQVIFGEERVDFISNPPLKYEYQAKISYCDPQSKEIVSEIYAIPFLNSEIEGEDVEYFLRLGRSNLASKIIIKAVTNSGSIGIEKFLENLNGRVSELLQGKNIKEMNWHVVFGLRDNLDSYYAILNKLSKNYLVTTEEYFEDWGNRIEEDHFEKAGQELDDYKFGLLLPYIAKKTKNIPSKWRWKWQKGRIRQLALCQARLDETGRLSPTDNGGQLSLTEGDNI